MFKSQILKIVIGSIQVIAISPLLPVVALAHICAMIEPGMDQDQLSGKAGKSKSPSDSFSMGKSQMVSDSFLVA